MVFNGIPNVMDLVSARDFGGLAKLHLGGDLVHDVHKGCDLGVSEDGSRFHGQRDPPNVEMDAVALQDLGTSMPALSLDFLGLGLDCD